MSDERVSRPATHDAFPWLDWLVKPLRHLLGGHLRAESRSHAPLGAGPRAHERRSIVERSRAGDVYRL
jgi:hypothetical protein